MNSSSSNIDKITIEIEDPKTVSDDLSDLLCWWQGFMMGLKVSDNTNFVVAENGIEAARKLKLKIGDSLINSHLKARI